MRFSERSCGHRSPTGTNHCVWCHPPRLSADPVVVLLRERAAQMGVRPMSAAMATRLGMDAMSLEKRIRRLMDGTYKSLTLSSADELAIGLGQSPQGIWGAEWDIANPVEEPYGDEEF